MDDARIGGENDEESPEVEKMGYENNVKRKEIVFSGEPGEMEDVVEDEDWWGEEEGEEDLFFIGAGYREKYMKKILPSQQEYSSSI